MKKNIDENIVLDEQQKEDEQSKKKMPKDKVKRIVLAVLLLILAVAFVVLGAFCATGYIDKFSTSANVAYADTIVDFDDVYNFYNLNGADYLSESKSGVSPSITSFLITEDISLFFGSDYSFTCTNKPIFEFYRLSDNRKVADILLTRHGELVGNLSLRIFADDKLSSYTTLKLFDFYSTADDNGALTLLGVRTFTNTYTFGCDYNSVVYCKTVDLSDEEQSDVYYFVSDISAVFWFADFSLYNDLQSDYNDLQSDYNDLQSDYKVLEEKYRAYEDCFTFIPNYYSYSSNSFSVGDRMKFPVNTVGDCLLLITCSEPYNLSLYYDSEGNVDVHKLIDPFYCTLVSNFNYTDIDYFYNDLNKGSDELNIGPFLYDSDGIHRDGYRYLACLLDGELVLCTDVVVDNGLFDSLLTDYYNAGLQDGKDEVVNTTDTVVNGIIDVVESPVEFLKTVFNFEIFGINISSVIFFVISIVIVAFVIKKVV